MRIPFFLILLISSTLAFGQYKINGKVTDISNNKAVVSASVYLNNTTIGTTTQNDGTFVIPNIKEGQYELVISIVGYDTYSQKIFLNRDTSMREVRLMPRAQTLHEVVIKASSLYYEIFKNVFLGKSDYAKQCKILNPQVLDIYHDDSTRSIHASSYRPLEIENDALGYKLKYQLNNFVLDSTKMTFSYKGSVMFSEMSGTPSQQRKWKKNRKNAYEGSMMHFFRSCSQVRADEAGFRVVHFARRKADASINLSEIKIKLNNYRKEYPSANYKRHEILMDSINFLKGQVSRINGYDDIDQDPLKITDFIFSTNIHGVYAINIQDFAFVFYTKRHHGITYVSLNPGMPDYQTSVISLKDKNILFDANGALFDTDAVLTEGYWADSRVADTLPIDYEPEKP
jgi:hypothetical protein